MIYFSSRSKAREFAKGKRKIVDNGVSAGSKRWAVVVLNKGA